MRGGAEGSLLCDLTYGPCGDMFGAERRSKPVFLVQQFSAGKWYGVRIVDNEDDAKGWVAWGGSKYRYKKI